MKKTEGEAERFLEDVRFAMKDALKTTEPKLKEVIEFLFSTRGKMYRPKLLFLCYRAAGGQRPEEIVNMGASLELIHLGTLVHDDIADKAYRRRGKPTLSRLFGEDTALITGDYMFSKGFELSVKYGEEILLKASRTCGCLVEGEMLQSRHLRDWTMDLETYYRIAELKTARVFSAAAETGASVAKSSKDIEKALGSFGLLCGMAFQIQDDIMDLLGEESVTGKDVGSDIRRGKNTILTIHALRHLSGKEKEVLLKAIINEEPPDTDAVRRLVLSAGSKEWAEKQSEEFVKKGLEELEVLPFNPWTEALHSFAWGCIRREK